MKKLIALSIVLILALSLIGCANSSRNSSGDNSSSVKVKTEEDYVRLEVESHNSRMKYTSTIDGIKLNSVRTDFYNIKKRFDGKYDVTGSILATDIYGTRYTNTFECMVVGSGENWNVKNYKEGEHWRRL